MCGINVVISNRYDIEKTLLRMNQTLVHRGPDAEGLWYADGIGLGFRRLSIIDLNEEGGQPHFNEDKTVISICNGELYNYKALRSELQKKGHRFYSQNDTELIPHLYEEYGADFVQLLNGMFAIAVHDLRRNITLVYRDRLGIKPVFYTSEDDTIIVSSEIKAIRSVKESKVRRELVSDYLVYEYIPGANTAWEGICKLPQGHYMSVQPGGVDIVPYWKPNFSPAGSNYPADGARLESLFADSVRLRMQSDVPVGILFSGGLDSSLVSYYAQQAAGDANEILCFHARMPGEKSEAHYAREFAGFIGAEYVEIPVELDEFYKHLDICLNFMDEPIGDSAMITNYLINQKASEFVKVMLSGTGGDELFGGYGRYVRGVRSPASDFYKQMCYFSLEEVKQLTRASSRPEQFLQNLVDENIEDKANRLMWIDVRSYLVDQLLAIADRMSMAHSLELRQPFLDHRVVEHAMSLPADHKMPDQGKKILKDLLRKVYREEYVSRPKQGFGVPLQKWMERQKDNVLNYILKQSSLCKFYDMDRDALKNMLTQKHPLQKNRLWNVYVLARWTDQVI